MKFAETSDRGFTPRINNKSRGVKWVKVNVCEPLVFVVIPDGGLALADAESRMVSETIRDGFVVWSTLIEHPW